MASPLSELEQTWTRTLVGNITPKIKSNITYNALNYTALSENPNYQKTLAQIKKFPLSSLKTKNEKRSFWINTYNIAAINLMLKNPQKTSIKDLSSFRNSVWKQPAITIEGKHYSLGEIEHDILRKLSEPRIHFAIVCASLSCPDLKETAYTAQNLDQELAIQTQKFFANSTKGYNPQTEKISKIIKWFKKDFKEGRGLKLPNHKGYLPYNWRKND